MNGVCEKPANRVEISCGFVRTNTLIYGQIVWISRQSNELRQIMLILFPFSLFLLHSTPTGLVSAYSNVDLWKFRRRKIIRHVEEAKNKSIFRRYISFFLAGTWNISCYFVWFLDRLFHIVTIIGCHGQRKFLTDKRLPVS